MTLLRQIRVVALTGVVLGFAATVLAQGTQAPAKPFEPQVGQAGKDVVWVPTPQALVEKMLDLAKVTPQDFLMDLGSGDGRTVITVRPSPEPRSMTKSSLVTLARSSILSTRTCGVGTQTTSLPSCPTEGS